MNSIFCANGWDGWLGNCSIRICGAIPKDRLVHPHCLRDGDFAQKETSASLSTSRKTQIPNPGKLVRQFAVTRFCVTFRGYFFCRILCLVLAKKVFFTKSLWVNENMHFYGVLYGKLLTQYTKDHIRQWSGGTEEKEVLWRGKRKEKVHDFLVPRHSPLMWVFASKVARHVLWSNTRAPRGILNFTSKV